jgi:hypothetical protein
MPALMKPIAKPQDAVDSQTMQLIEYQEDPFVQNPTRAVGPSSESLRDWTSYANGGAAADDAELLKKQQEIEAQFLESIANRNNSQSNDKNSSGKLRSAASVTSPQMMSTLVKVSPVKAPSSPANTNLLIDLENNSMPSRLRYQWKDTFSYLSQDSPKPSYQQVLSGRREKKQGSSQGALSLLD